MEYEDYFFLFVMIYNIFYKSNDNNISVNANISYPINYLDIPNNFTSNENYLKLLNILTKFDTINSNIFNSSTICDGIVNIHTLNFEFLFRVKAGFKQSVVLYYFANTKQDIEDKFYPQ
jgi:hypothetical protein